ncbi:MAG: DUF2231 domain-containing protein [Thermodesulfobacteriota bacterium]
MGKFEVCIRGENFLIKTGGTVTKKAFYAARFIEARDMSTAVSMAMDSLRSELKGAVMNDQSDPPVTSVADISEVYYFQENMVVGDAGDMVLPGKGIVWDAAEEAVAGPDAPFVDPFKVGWSALREGIKEKELHVHSMSIHFTNALYPVAVLFMFLALIFGRESFHQTHFFALLLATLSAPVSYLTGIIEWRRRFTGAMIPIFIEKIRYGVVILILGAAATLWRVLSPGVLEEGGLLGAAYVVLNLAILLPMAYLGYLGGTIVYEGREELLGAAEESRAGRAGRDAGQTP